MNLLVIGIDRPGTTSHHRRLVLERLLPEADAFSVDTNVPFADSPRLARSVAFRWRRGPAVAAVNRYLLEQIEATPCDFDLTWVDKAVYLAPETTRILRERSRHLVHYTPDTAFLGNRSHHYFASGALYDRHVTTKSLEVDYYRRAFPSTPVTLTTQGYHEDLHRPCCRFEEKADEVAFVGLAEPSRFEAVEALLASGIPVRLAGHGWRGFVDRHRNSSPLHFHGESLSGENYARFLASARFALGLVSKRFPELHTTRTFEIPACGTALITERNDETSDFFSEDEAVFFSNLDEMVERIAEMRTEPTRIAAVSEAGRQRVLRDGRSYRRILAGILDSLGFQPVS